MVKCILRTRDRWEKVIWREAVDPRITIARMIDDMVLSEVAAMSEDLKIQKVNFRLIREFINENDERVAIYHETR